jgi:Tol biopolymer transport system component
MVTTDAAGSALINIILAAPPIGEVWISATATDAAGNTSEFSNCAMIGAHVVSNTNDSGEGSLREAILNANVDNATDTIRFNIPGSGPRTIAPLTPLPVITTTVVIDGATQPGFAGMPVIELDGVNLPGGNNAGLAIAAPNSVIRALVVNRFVAQPLSGIRLNVGSNGTTIEGCYVGVDPSGNVARPNNVGILVLSDNAVIGGMTVAARNVVSGNFLSGINIFGSGTVIAGNFIGTNAAGMAAIPNVLDGIRSIAKATNTIGGIQPAARNIISGNGFRGVYLQGNGAVVRGNSIGVRVDGTALPNEAAGVSIEQFLSDPDSGHNNIVEANDIRFNNGPGVRVLFGAGNRISQNVMGGNTGLDIDLNGTGVTPNDPGDADTGPNNLQNFPVLQSANTAGGGLTIQGTLGSTPSTNFTLEFYRAGTNCAAGLNRAGTFIGSAQIATGASGTIAFTVNFASPIAAGEFVSATATDSAANTSEVSACLLVSANLFISGAITDSNNAPLANAEVRLSGSQQTSVLTGSNGAYAFTNLPTGGNYSVTPVKTNFTFSPPVRSFNNLAASSPNQNFTGTRIFNISGHVMSRVNGGSFPLGGVTLTLSGAAGRTAQTAADGSYAFNDIPQTGNFAVTAAKAGFVITPSSTPITGPLQHDEVVNFEAEAALTLTGRITFAGSGKTIHAMNADSSAEVTLIATAPGSIGDFDPQWTRDGQKLVFRRDRFVQNLGGTVAAGEIFSANSDGTAVTRLTQPGSTFSDAEPAWSPDNRLIVFVRRSSAPGSASPNQLIVMNADGTNPIQIPLNVSASFRSISSPDWSPDGTTIVFSMSFFGSRGRHIFAVAPNGSTLRQLTTTGTPDSFAPAWSPDGAKIAFLRTAAGTLNPFAVFTMGAAGGRPSQVAAAAIAGKPAWTPDAFRIAYVRRKVSNPSTNELVLSGEGPVLFTGQISQPSWSIQVQTPTPAGANVQVQQGGTAISFTGVTAAGQTTVTTIPAGSAGNVPGGFVLGNVAVEIASTAITSPPITVCLTAPQNITQAAFNALSLLHNEGGTLVDRTTSRNFATRTVCGLVNSLSPFALGEAVNPGQPGISGLVRDVAGNPIGGASITLTGPETRTAVSDSNGLFAFVNLPAGASFTLEAWKLGFIFSSPAQSVVSLSSSAQLVFEGATASFTIGGRISNIRDRAITIRVEGDVFRQTVTDGNGQYVFTGVPAAGSYTVTPSALETVFSPPQTVIAYLDQNEPNVNFRIVRPDEPPPPAVIPELKCVIDHRNGTFTALFGYVNESAVPVSIPVGPSNRFITGARDRGQPGIFLPGRTENAVSVTFKGSQLIWELTDVDQRRNIAVATTNSPRCR